MNQTNSIGRYARILLDGFFKTAFGSEKNKKLTTLFLEELIPDRKIVDLAPSGAKGRNLQIVV